MRLVMILVDIILVTAVTWGFVCLANKPRLSRDRTYTRIVACVTVLAGLVAVSGGAALVMRGRSTSAFAICAVICSGALMAVGFVAMIASSPLNVAANRTTRARIVLGLDAAVVGSSLFGGALSFFLLNMAAGFSWPLLAAYLCLAALGIVGARLAVIGVLVAAGWTRAVRLFAPLRTIRIWPIGPDLTFSGWVVLVVSMLLVLIVGVQLAIMLYQGVRPPGWPTTVLALPILTIGLFTLIALMAGAQALGIRLTTTGRERSSRGSASVPDNGMLDLPHPVLDQELAWYGAMTYTNCLLTLISEKSLGPITLADGEPLPDLRRMATTQEDHDFIEEIGLPVRQINASNVISILLHLAMFRWYRPFKKVGTLRAQLAQQGGELDDVSFRVSRSRQSQGRRVVLSRREAGLPWVQ